MIEPSGGIRFCGSLQSCLRVDDDDPRTRHGSVALVNEFSLNRRRIRCLRSRAWRTNRKTMPNRDRTTLNHLLDTHMLSVNLIAAANYYQNRISLSWLGRKCVGRHAEEVRGERLMPGLCRRKLRFPREQLESFCLSFR